jgi:signal transduction histidine kinase
MDHEPSKAIEPMDYILSLAEAGLAEMRALIFELRPESLRTEGLVAAIGKLVNALGTRHQLEVQMEAGEEPQIPLEAKESLYRITQEAINNIAKHARARLVKIKLGTEKDRLKLDITDDGVGFDTSQRFPGHLGLQTMSERVAQLGGTFTLESVPDQGTHIQVQIPFAQTG